MGRCGRSAAVRYPASCDEFAEGFALQQFHHDKGLGSVFFHSVNGADVGMVQGGCSSGLALKSLNGQRICRQFLGKKLQGYQAVELQILRLVNQPHSAAAQQSQYAVV